MCSFFSLFFHTRLISISFSFFSKYAFLVCSSIIYTSRFSLNPNEIIKTYPIQLFSISVKFSSSINVQHTRPPLRFAEITCSKGNWALTNGAVGCNGYIGNLQYRINSTCRFRCYQGFQLVGFSTSVCTDTGHDRGTYIPSSPAPFCQGKQQHCLQNHHGYITFTVLHL